MSKKVNIKKLDSLSHNDAAATKLINDNFAALQQGIEDSLSRTGKTPNFMDAELDMNSRRIINTGDPVDDTDVVTYGAYKKHMDDAKAAADKALNSEKNAAAAANEAKYYANKADASVKYVDESVDTVNKIVEDGKADLNRIVDEGIMDISDLTEDGKKTLNDIVEDYYTKEEIDTKISTAGGSSYLYPYTILTTAWIEREGEYTGEYTYQAGVAGYITDASEYASAVLAFSEEDAVSGNFSPVFEWFQGDFEQGLNRVTFRVFAKTIPDHNVTVNITFIH